MVDDKNRQDGWYWAKCRYSDEWQVLEWKNGVWYNLKMDYGSLMIQEVGQRIPSPDEPWQSVPVDATSNMLEASGHDTSYEAGVAWQDMLKEAPKP